MSLHRAIVLFGMFGAGVALGAFYFHGLKLTIDRINVKGRFRMLLAVSFFVRLIVVGAAFYWLMQHDWQRLIALTCGFLLARTVLLRRGVKALQDAGDKQGK